ncbi:hypothetical protein A2U01_0039800, partial [Trifolium medium]|nr:hypothetical protein [Trifolium medium]
MEQVSEVKDVIFLEKARNPFSGNLGWLDSLRDLRRNGKVEIRVRSALRSPSKRVRLREVRFGNLVR